ncbi:MAG: DNA repair protein RadC [Bacillota bacterium]|nr:DNA repair protein RadC [Bacillota bacterium]
MEMKEEERPREKALRFGFDVLSDEELLAIILQNGNRHTLVFEMAKEVLDRSEGLSKLFDLSVNELMQIPGIKEAKALNLMASVELCKRVLRKSVYQTVIQSPVDVFNWFQMEIGFDKQEQFVVIFVDSKLRIITHKILFKGTLTESSVHPRNIYKEAFLANAHSILCVHNHPSGDPTPSQADISFTQQLFEIGMMMGIELRDHIIVGRNKWFSFKQQKYLD